MTTGKLVPIRDTSHSVAVIIGNVSIGSMPIGSVPRGSIDIPSSLGGFPNLGG